MPSLSSSASQASPDAVAVVVGLVGVRPCGGSCPRRRWSPSSSSSVEADVAVTASPSVSLLVRVRRRCGSCPPRRRRRRCRRRRRSASPCAVAVAVDLVGVRDARAVVDRVPGRRRRPRRRASVEVRQSPAAEQTCAAARLAVDAPRSGPRGGRPSKTARRRIVHDMVGPPAGGDQVPARRLRQRDQRNVSAFVRVASLPATSVALTLSRAGSRFSLRSFLRSAALGRIVTVTAASPRRCHVRRRAELLHLAARAPLDRAREAPGSATSSFAASLTLSRNRSPSLRSVADLWRGVGEQRDHAACRVDVRSPPPAGAGWGGAGAPACWRRAVVARGCTGRRRGRRRRSAARRSST